MTVSNGDGVVSFDSPIFPMMVLVSFALFLFLLGDLIERELATIQANISHSNPMIFDSNIAGLDVTPS